MTVKKTTGAYRDCALIMDEMLRGGGGFASFETSQKATIFRHRCYKLRKLLFTASERGMIPGMIPSTPYDDLYIKMEPDGTVLEFCLRSKESLPTVETKEKPNSALDFDLE